MSYRTYRGGIDVVPNLPSVRHRYWWCTELTEVSGTGIDAVPNLPKCPVPVWKFVPVSAVPVSMSYRTYRSVWYRYWRRTELTEVSGTGIDVVPNLPKYPVPVIPAVYTAGMPQYLPYRTHPCIIALVQPWVAGKGATIEWSHLPRKIVREKRLSFFLRLKILGHTSKYQTTRNYNRVSSAARRFIHKWADNYYWRPGSLRIQPIPRSLLYVVGLSVGMMSVSAVLCCCRRSCCLCMLPPRSPKTLFYCQKVPQNLTNKS